MNRRGFTLLEVMVSVGLLGVIMTLLWGTTSQSLRAKDRIEARDAVFHSADVALRKMSDDLMAAFLSRGGASPAAAAAPGGAAPAPTPAPASTTPAPKTFFIGEDRGDQDGLRFSALSHLRLVKQAKESDQAKVAYEVVANQDIPGTYDVVRREEVWLNASTEVEGRGYALIEGVARFNLEYYDDRRGDWVKEWSTEQVDWKDRLPMAVRITLVFKDPDDEQTEIPLSTAVSLPLAPGPIEF